MCFVISFICESCVFVMPLKRITNLYDCYFLNGSFKNSYLIVNFIPVCRFLLFLQLISDRSLINRSLRIFFQKRFLTHILVVDCRGILVRPPNQKQDSANDNTNADEDQDLLKHAEEDVHEPYIEVILLHNTYLILSKG